MLVDLETFTTACACATGAFPMTCDPCVDVETSPRFEGVHWGVSLRCTQLRFFNCFNVTLIVVIFIVPARWGSVEWYGRIFEQKDASKPNTYPES